MGLLSWVLPLGLAWAGLSNLGVLFGKKQTAGKALSFVYLLLAAALLAVPRLFSGWVVLLFGVWALLNGGMRLLNGITLKKDKAPGYRRAFLDAGIALVFGILLLSHPLDRLPLMVKWFGIYLMVYSLTLLGDAAGAFLKTNYGKTKVRKRVRVALPVLVAAFLPRKLLDSVNESLRREAPQAPEGETSAHTLEVFIHLKKGLMEGFGHVDLCLDDTVYSYGCYDTSAHRLLGLVSHGVLAIAPREAYIRHCLRFEKKVLVGYVIALNPEQYRQVQKEIRKLLGRSVPWKCPAETGSGKDLTDPASLLYLDTGASFVKFREGKGKTYYVFGTNCVLLADEIIGRSGIDLVRTNGILTPGTYYSHLDALWKMGNTNVTERRFYGQAPSGSQEKQAEAET